MITQLKPWSEPQLFVLETEETQVGSFAGVEGFTNAGRTYSS